MLERIIISSLSLFGCVYAQPQMRINLATDSSLYVKLTFTNQVWMRWNQSNPGSMVYDYPKEQTYDIGLRRTRIQLYVQLADRVFVYTQFGQNNFNYLSSRKTGSFFHDATGEYALLPGNLSLGAGLCAWTGFARFSAPSIAGILSLDAPLFQQATNDASDQFLRKLSVYAKGKIKKLDYRLAASQPMAIQNSSFGNEVLNSSASFSPKPPKLQSHGYFMYHFAEVESNLIPYLPGTYLGQKRVFNIGSGFVYQPAATWSLSGSDTLEHQMFLLGVDVFYDAPLQRKGSAISLYGGYYRMDFGPRYIRNVGPMNPANALASGTATFNGPGNAYPMIGTGNVVYAQAGYLFTPGPIGLMPYVSFFAGDFEALNDPVLVYHAGFNVLLKGHNSKLTLDYENRPVFEMDALTENGRRSGLVLQYQVAF